MGAHSEVPNSQRIHSDAWRQADTKGPFAGRCGRSAELHVRQGHHQRCRVGGRREDGPHAPGLFGFGVVPPPSFYGRMCGLTGLSVSCGPGEERETKTGRWAVGSCTRRSVGHTEEPDHENGSFQRYKRKVNLRDQYSDSEISQPDKRLANRPWREPLEVMFHHSLNQCSIAGTI
jgi:hypothetical protein